LRRSYSLGSLRGVDCLAGALPKGLCVCGFVGMVDQNTVTRMWRMQCSPLARTTWQYSQLTPLRGAYTQADAIPFLTTVTITTIDPRLNQLTILATDRFSLAISARRTLNSRTVPASMQVIMVPSCAWLTGSSEF